jgi:hypothetical protein
MNLRSVLRVCVSVLWVLVFSVSAQAATVTLEWNRNPEADVLGYWISYGTASRQYSVEVHAGNNTSHVLTINPSATATYFFAVQAYNANGRSAYSAEVSTVISVSTPTINIERPTANAALPNDLYLTGWAIDRAATSGPGVDVMHVYAYNVAGGAPMFVGAASYGMARPDVAAAFGANFANSGFALPIPFLPNGTWDLAVYGHSTVANAFNVVQTRRVRIFTAPPLSNTVVQQDLPVAASTVGTWLTMAGWALDLRSTSGTGVNLVQAWAFPNPGSGAMPFVLGNAPYGLSRADVGAAFGSRYTNSGYRLDVVGMNPGVYDIVVMARSSITGFIETSRVKRVTVFPEVMVMVDTPVNGGSATGNFLLQGWTIDRRQPQGQNSSGVDQIHVYAYNTAGGAPVPLGIYTPNLPRADVAAAYGSRFLNCGYVFTVSGLSAGTYDIVIYARSTITGGFDNVRNLRVTVQ